MAWTHNNWRNASFNPHKKDDRLLASTVTAVRQHRVVKPSQEEPKKEDVSLDLVDVLNRPPAARVKWLQKGLCFVAAKGKAQITALYDIVLHRKFVSDISVELARQMLELLNANLHLFSVKQKQVLEVKLNMLGDFLATVSDDESSESEEEPAAPERAPSRSTSPSREAAANGSTTGQAHESSMLEADTASTAKRAANAAAAASFASAAKEMAAAAQKAAAAAAAAPVVAPSALSVATPTTQDAFPSQSKTSRSRSASLHVKEKEKEKKRKRSRSIDGVLEKKKKRKKSRSRSKKRSRSRSKKKKSRSRSKKKSRSRSRKRSQSRSKKKSRSRSRKKSRSRSKKKKSRSRSKKKKSRSRSRRKSRSRSKAKRRAKSSSSSSSTSKSRTESKHHRSSPKRGPGDSSIWLPPPMSAKEAVASGGKDDDIALRLQGVPMSGSQADGRRVGEKPAAGTNPQLRPGDWFCPLCGAHNYSSKSQCFRCVKAPPSNPSSVPSASAQQNLAFSTPMPPPSGGLMPTGDSLRQAQLNAARRLAAVPSPAAPVRSGDWFCSVCNAHNFASKSKCFRCMQGKNPRMAGGMM